MIRSDICVRESEDGEKYCLFSDMDPTFRESVRRWARERLATFEVGGEEAVGVETVIAYSQSINPFPKIMG